MAAFFPRETIGSSAIEETPLVRRLSITPWPLAIAAGMGVRLAHAALFGGESGSWVKATLYAAILILFACGALTAHVGNFTVRTWTWRVPIFAVTEALAEGVGSLALIAVGLERIGADHATLGQWPTIAVTIVRDRLLLLCGFGVVLAFAVEGARYAFYKPTERRQMDAEAATEVAAITTAEQESANDPPIAS